MNEEKSSFDDRFRIDQKGLDDAPLSGKTRYSRRRTSEISIMKIVVLGGVVIALLVVMFILFKSSGNVDTLPGKTEGDPIANNVAMITLLEQRMERLESALADVLEKVSAFNNGGPKGTDTNVDVLAGRVDRVETAMSAKFNIIVENLDKLDIQMADVVNRVKALEKTRGVSVAERGVSESPSSSGATNLKTSGTSQKSPVEKNTPSTTVQGSDKKTALKKTTQTGEKKAAATHVYHVVQKGETFYSISRKYDTTVEQIHKLNHFSKQPTIYPGDKLIVK